jgi:hypothetical protein
MSISEAQIRDIKNGCNASVEGEMKNNKQKAKERKRELEQNEEKLFSLEEK